MPIPMPIPVPNPASRRPPIFRIRDGVTLGIATHASTSTVLFQESSPTGAAHPDATSNTTPIASRVMTTGNFCQGSADRVTTSPTLLAINTLRPAADITHTGTDTGTDTDTCHTTTKATVTIMTIRYETSIPLFLHFQSFPSACAENVNGTVGPAILQSSLVWNCWLVYFAQGSVSADIDNLVKFHPAFKLKPST